MDFLKTHIEALIFCSPSPLTIEEMQSCLSGMFNTDILQENIALGIDELVKKYSSDDFSFQLYKASGGYQFLTKPAYQAGISLLLKQQSKKRLSISALETLSIIAYKQPVSKPDIENIRGVSCDYSIQRLLNKGLIKIQGKAKTIGRPLLYQTSPKFMEYFGLNDLSELPTLKDFSDEITPLSESVPAAVASSD